LSCLSPGGSPGGGSVGGLPSPRPWALFPGIYPKVEDINRNRHLLNLVFTKPEPGCIYMPVREAESWAVSELDRIVELKFARKFADWAEVLSEVGDVVIADLGLMVKTQPNDTLAVSLLADVANCEYEYFIQAYEKLVWPRVEDVTENIAALRQYCDKEERLHLFSASFVDAGRTFALHKEEKASFVVQHPKQGYVGFNVVPDGGAGCQLVWGRAASYLARSGQSMFEENEARVEIHTDDINVVWRGSEHRARRSSLVLLLWWSCAGPGVNWGEVRIAQSVKWLNVQFTLLDEDRLKWEIPGRYMRDLLTEAQELAQMSCICRERLQRYACKIRWATGLFPGLATFLNCIEKAIADSQAAEQTRERAAKNNMKQQHAVVPVWRFWHALRWLAVLFKKGTKSYGGKNPLGKTLQLSKHYEEVDTLVIADASDVGGGAWLVQEGRPQKWMMTRWTSEDHRRLGTKMGERTTRLTLETFMVLIAVRQWYNVLKDRKFALKVREGSSAGYAALGMAGQLSVGVCRVFNELAVFFALCNYPANLASERIQGVDDGVAAALANWREGDTVPKLLAHLEPCNVDARVALWWLTVE